MAICYRMTTRIMREIFYPIPQTMAGIEIEIDSDEFQEWYKAFTTFPSQAISEAQYQINAVINKFIEGGNRTNRQ